MADTVSVSSRGGGYASSMYSDAYSLSSSKKAISAQEDELSAVTCPCCLDSFRSPVTLSCGHHVCRSCAADLLQHKKAVRLAARETEKAIKELEAEGVAVYRKSSDDTMALLSPSSSILRKSFILEPKPQEENNHNNDALSSSDLSDAQPLDPLLSMAPISLRSRTSAAASSSSSSYASSPSLHAHHHPHHEDEDIVITPRNVPMIQPRSGIAARMPQLFQSLTLRHSRASQELSQQQQQQQQQMEDAGPHLGFLCPICSQETLVPESVGVAVLQENEALAAQVAEKVTRVFAVLCGVCDDSPAEFDCIQCQGPFCEKCCIEVHQKGILRKHDVRPHIDGKKMLRCVHHSEEYCLFYCLEEQVLVCTNCLLSGPHKNHKVLANEEMVVRIRERVAGMQVEVDGERSEVNKVRAEVVQALNIINGEYHDVIGRINAHFDQLEKMLKARKEFLIQETYDEKMREMNALKKYMVMVDIKDRLLTQNANFLQRHVDDEEVVILRNAVLMGNRVRDMNIELPPLETKPVYIIYETPNQEILEKEIETFGEIA